MMIFGILAMAGSVEASTPPAQSPPAAEYRILSGNTHAHTSITWSHGEMFDANECAGVRTYTAQHGGSVPGQWEAPSDKQKAPCPRMYVINGWQYHASDTKLRANWQTLQGPPAVHFDFARSLGLDWYVTSDHSQEATFLPGELNWSGTKRAAEDATRDGFIALAGFEYSENDGPGGTGHINVINSAEMLNALEPGTDLPKLYSWLARAGSENGEPVVASFNHPDADSFAKFGGRTEEATDVITLLEVVNSNSRLHEAGFIAALDAGWKVSPVSGLDNHGIGRLSALRSRTFVLARDNTRYALLAAMRARRTYAALDENIECRYTVNGMVMGSTLARAAEFHFDIMIRDPDVDDPRDRITRIEIVKDGGVVVATHVPQSPAAEVRWQTQLRDPDARYFFVRIWSDGGRDVPEVEADSPVAWLAPVWTGGLATTPAPAATPRDSAPRADTAL